MMRLLKCDVHLMEKSIARVIDKNLDVEELILKQEKIQDLKS